MQRTRLSLVLGGLGLLLLATVLSAQPWQPPMFIPAQRAMDVPYLHEYGWVAVADFDKDGDLDVFMACSNNRSRLFLNDGHGRFTDAPCGWLPDTAAETVDQGVAVGDVDRDGDPDIVMSHGDWDAQEPPLTVWINKGGGRFVDQTAARLPAIHCRPVALADVDRDGDLDILCGRSGAQDALLLNNGAGYFTDVTATHMPPDAHHSFCFAVGDVNGDGAPDVAVGTWKNQKGERAQPDALYLNDGFGKFTSAPATSLPATATQTRGIILFDWEGDGDLDLLLAKGFHYEPDSDALYLNNGAGVFTEDTLGQLPVVSDGSRTYCVADVDKDGDLDLFTPQVRQSRLLRNDLSGKFTDVTAAKLPVDTNRTRTAAFGDMDGDRDVDLVVSSGNQLQLLRNDGTGAFSTWFDSWMPIKPTSSEGVAFGDVDGDGDLDAVFANYPVYPDVPYRNLLYINDGYGRFTDQSAARLPLDTDAACCVVLTDVDGDKDLDIVFGIEGQTRLYLNDGSGFFSDATSTHMPAKPGYTYGLALGDFDGDGDQDLVLANWGQDYLFLNQGGKFVDATSQIPADGDESRGVEVGDVDGDKDLDIVIGNGFYYERANKILLNDGHANFTLAPASWLPDVQDVTLDIALGDIDGDGDLDLYEGTGIELYGLRKDHLYLNDGTGKFTEVTDARLPGIVPDRTFCVTMADFDEDGDLDIYASKSHYYADIGAQNKLWLNDGKGYFTDATAALPVCHDHTDWLAVGDVDGDGDLDVLAACYYEPQLFLNVTRQVWAPDAPRYGAKYRVETYARVANRPSSLWVVPFIGRTPWPAWPLAIERTHPMTAVATTTFKVGRHPAVIGVSVFYLRSLVEQRHGWKFTNTLEEVVIR